MEQSTRAFFRQQQQVPENQACLDYGTANPQWASVSHGCYVSLEASGVHRSLGVHISFIRSTTMDSWKPSQLKLMELGGNQKLMAFFREHNIPDGMPIAEKYSTRAAEWYRKNLRALAEGKEPPPPLPPGTGALPMGQEPAVAAAFPDKAAAGTSHTGGYATAAETAHAGNYHSGGSSSSSGSPAAPGSSGDQPAEQNLFSGLLGAAVGSKVSDKWKDAVGLVGNFANKAKTAVEERAGQAQREGLLDTVFDTAKQGLGAAVETTTWASQKSVEASKATYTYINDGGGKDVLGKTTEALESTARTSMAFVGSGVDWVSQHLGAEGSAAGLQKMSSGTMQGFGSDSVSPSSPSVAAGYPAAGTLAPAQAPVTRPSYHEDLGPPAPPTRQDPAASPSQGQPPSKATLDLWGDDDWDEWS